MLLRNIFLEVKTAPLFYLTDSIFLHASTHAVTSRILFSPPAAALNDLLLFSSWSFLRFSLGVVLYSDLSVG